MIGQARQACVLLHNPANVYCAIADSFPCSAKDLARCRLNSVPMFALPRSRAASRGQRFGGAPLARKATGCENLVMQESDPAQAAQLVRALCDQLREMTAQLAWADARNVPGPNGHATRLDAAALRRDIAEAQMHIDRLQRRYRLGEERLQQRPNGAQPRSLAYPQAR